MSLDSRVRVALERSSQLVDPDVRRDLAEVRRKHRGAEVRRSIVIAVLAASVLSAAVLLAPGALDLIRGQGRSPSQRSGVSVSPIAPYPLVGTWVQQQSCDDFVRVLTGSGFAGYVPKYLVGNGYRDGPASKIAAEAAPCDGAGPALGRTWTFDGTRLLGFLNGVRVDIAFPTIIDDHTIRVSHINLRFTIDGDALRFIAPPVPRSCTGHGCRSQHAWAVAAFGLGPWTRVT
jgi:hypothetical protein